MCAATTWRRCIACAVAQALELVVHGDIATCQVVGRRVEQLDLPSGVAVVTIVRGAEPAAGTPDGRQVLIAHHDTVIVSGDHVILFLTSKDLVPTVERQFQGSRGFF